jgi:hypothetical protein
MTYEAALLFADPTHASATIGIVTLSSLDVAGVHGSYKDVSPRCIIYA